LLLHGCASTPNGETRYVLCDPSAAMVSYYVNGEDQLSLTLSDGSMQRMTVEAVDGASIIGADGMSIPIDTVHELRVEDSEVPVITQVMFGALYPVLGTASIVLLPVLIPAVLLYDEDAIDNWKDDRLCEVSGHPMHYGYLETGQHATDNNMPGVPEIVQELERRGLSCDLTERAEKKCAPLYYSGFQFSDCVEIVTSMERAGFSAVSDWSDEALCEVDQNPSFVHRVFPNMPGLTEESTVVQEMAAAAKEQVQQKDLVCPRPLGPPLTPYQVRVTHTACPTRQDLGR
jgi:hypothetical protein